MQCDQKKILLLEEKLVFLFIYLTGIFTESQLFRFVTRNIVKVVTDTMMYNGQLIN